MIRSPSARLLLLSCGTAALASFAFAQEAGVTLTFGLRERIEIDTNDRLAVGDTDPEAISRTDLSFNLESRTRTRRIFIGGDSRILLAEDDREVLDQRRARLGFSEQLTEGSRISFNADYSEAELSSFVFADSNLSAEDVFLLESLGLEDQLDELDVLDREGTRSDTRLRFAVVLGENQPLGARFAADWSQRNFQLETDNPDIFDSTTWGVDGALTARLAPTLTGELSAGYREYDAEDVPETFEETRRASLGLNYVATEALRFGASIGVTEIDRTEFDVTDTTSVVTGGLSAERRLTNGTVGVTYARSANSAGAIDEVTLERALELPTGALSVSAGVGWPEDGDETAIIDATWTREMRAADFELGLSRELSQSSDGDTITATRLDADYSAALTEASSWRAGVSLAQVSGADITDTTRLEAEIAYARDLTRDWSLEAGYEYRLSDQDGRDRATSNAVFFSVGRDFVFRP